MSLYISSRPAGRGRFSPPPPVRVPVLLRFQDIAMQHRIYPAEFDLSHLMIDSYEITNNGKDLDYPIVPGNCYSMYFKFNRTLVSAGISGITTSMRKLRLPPGTTLFGVRFKPGTMTWFTDDPAQKMLDRLISMENVLPHSSELMQMIRESESFHERNLFIHQYLKKYIPAAYAHPPQRLKESLDAVDKQKGMCRVSELADFSGCSERYLGNLFQKYVGCSPKLYCEIMQMQYSLDDILQNQPKSLAQVAVAYGYFDQPHMNRVYHKLLGRTASDMRFFCRYK